MGISLSISKDARHRNQNEKLSKQTCDMWKNLLDFYERKKKANNSRRKYSIRIVCSSIVFTVCRTYRMDSVWNSVHHRNWSLPFIIRASGVKWPNVSEVLCPRNYSEIEGKAKCWNSHPHSFIYIRSIICDATKDSHVGLFSFSSFFFFSFFLH